MDTQTATTILKNNEHVKYFKDQLRNFQRAPETSLKDYLDIVNNDAVEWLHSLPKGVKSKSTFHKYKAPLYVLLEHKDIIDAYGYNYCTTVLRNLKQAFKDNIDKIISERKQIGQEEEVVVDEIHEKEDSDDESDLELDNIDIVEKTDKYEQHSKVHVKYDNLLVEHNELLREYALVKGLLERADKELSRVWLLVDKLSSK
jgi:hypothetical protein